jgi:small subunit ribosomal protein S1
MSTFLPEGILSQTEENTQLLKSINGIQDACNRNIPLEARAIVCDSSHNLIVDLGCMKGIIPKEECAIGIAEGTTRDIAIISKVNKPVSFFVTEIKKDANGNDYAVLSRKKLQLKCQEEYIKTLIPGDIIHGKVTHLDSFGCFVDIGCGIISLIPIDAISISRISHPRDRFQVGQNILAVVKSIDESGKICLSHKELLGTWEENAQYFSPGETVAGIVRSVENYGIFIELSPNLAGLAELKENVKVGQHASVYIKSLIPEKMKIKLIIVDHFDADYENYDYHYYVTSPHIDYWQYSPEGSSKVIETVFHT